MSKVYFCSCFQKELGATVSGTFRFSILTEEFLSAYERLKTTAQEPGVIVLSATLVLTLRTEEQVGGFASGNSVQFYSCL